MGDAAVIDEYRGTVPLSRDQMQAYISQEKADGEIAALVGRSEYAVRNLRLYYGIDGVMEVRRKRLALIDPPFRIAFPPSRGQMIWWLKAGFRDADIAHRYGKKRRQISQIRFNLSFGIDGEPVEHSTEEHAFERPVEKCGDLPAWVRFEDVEVRKLLIFRGVPKIQPKNLAELHDPAWRGLVIA